MRKLMGIIAFALAVTPAWAGLSAAETARTIDLITRQYAGLSSDEIVLLLRLRVSPYLIAETNRDGSITYWYERREAGQIVELSAIVTVQPAAPGPTASTR